MVRLHVIQTLRDYLKPGLDLVFVGINPGIKSAEAGHHYAGPGNHFWPLLFASGLVTEPLTYRDDARVIEWNIGLTNIVDRASRSSSDLSINELRGGAAALRAKLLRYSPRVACFNGKGIYEVFAGRPSGFGVQDQLVGTTIPFVMPSTSARTAAYQRSDKLRYFLELRGVVDGVRAEAAAP